MGEAKSRRQARNLPAREKAKARANTRDSPHLQSTIRQHLVKTRGQLVVRLDRQVMLMQGESSLVAFMQTGQTGILPLMLQKTANWRQLQKQGQQTQSLKRTLWQLMMDQLLTRVAKFAVGTEPLIASKVKTTQGTVLRVSCNVM